MYSIHDARSEKHQVIASLVRLPPSWNVFSFFVTIIHSSCPALIH